MISDNVFRNARNCMFSGDTDAFIKLLENTSPDDHDDIICAARCMFGHINPAMYGIMFEYNYFPTKLVPSEYKEELNEFEEFIWDILREEPGIFYGEDKPNMNYILETLAVIDAHIEGGLASYITVLFKRDDYINNGYFIGYPEEYPELSCNILDIYMGNGKRPSVEFPQIFIKLVELGIPIPPTPLYFVTRSDLPRVLGCHCKNPECENIDSVVTEFVPCNIVEKLILLGWVKTLKLLYEILPEVVIANITNAEKYLTLYEKQIELWKIEMYEPDEDITVFDEFSSRLNFYDILVEMREFIDSISAARGPIVL
jgi:hypothetical protein